MVEARSQQQTRCSILEEDAFKEEKERGDGSQIDALKQKEGENFQQKREKILEWFKQNGSGTKNSEWLKAKAIMLQGTLVEESLNRGSIIIESTLPPKNNKVLEKHPNTLLSGIKDEILTHQPKKNRQPFNNK